MPVPQKENGKMNGNKKIAALLAAVIGLGVTACGASAVSAQVSVPPMIRAHVGVKERHPELRRALRTLERTEAQLRASARDFGGHREKAADLCHQAEQEVQLALQYDNH
jgi:hypothetical protein